MSELRARQTCRRRSIVQKVTDFARSTRSWLCDRGAPIRLEFSIRERSCRLYPVSAIEAFEPKSLKIGTFKSTLHAFLVLYYTSFNSSHHANHQRAQQDSAPQPWIVQHYIPCRTAWSCHYPGLRRVLRAAATAAQTCNMPKEVQKRGRRMKRKAEDVPEDFRAEPSSKRLKEIEEFEATMPSFQEDEDMSAAYPAAEKVFFGMLDDDEQEYFKRADEMLELDQFGDPEERKLFLESVYREADGKELKIAHSQSCSRLLERLIRVSNAAQLKNLFQKFSGK